MLEATEIGALGPRQHRIVTSSIHSRSWHSGVYLRDLKALRRYEMRITEVRWQNVLLWSGQVQLRLIIQLNLAIILMQLIIVSVFVSI